MADPRDPDFEPDESRFLPDQDAAMEREALAGLTEQRWEEAEVVVDLDSGDGP